jgi:hypothetical protein
MRSSSHRGPHSEASSTRPGSSLDSSFATDTYRGDGADFRRAHVRPLDGGDKRAAHREKQKCGQVLLRGGWSRCRRLEYITSLAPACRRLIMCVCVVVDCVRYRELQAEVQAVSHALRQNTNQLCRNLKVHAHRKGIRHNRRIHLSDHAATQ